MYKKDFKKGAFGDKKGGKKFGGAKSFGGRPKFGGASSWNPGSRDGGSPLMHSATCSKCGKGCQLPFMPTGRKPVFCSNCFIKDDSAPPKRFGASSFGGGSSYGSRPSGENYHEQFKLLNSKIDTILKLLEEGN